MSQLSVRPVRRAGRAGNHPCQLPRVRPPTALPSGALAQRLPPTFELLLNGVAGLPFLVELVAQGVCGGQEQLGRGRQRSGLSGRPPPQPPSPRRADSKPAALAHRARSAAAAPSPPGRPAPASSGPGSCLRAARRGCWKEAAGSPSAAGWAGGGPPRSSARCESRSSAQSNQTNQVRLVRG